MLDFGKLEGPGALLVTKNLFDIIYAYTLKNKLITSTYDHGRGVNRRYTLSYCLQTNYHMSPKKYYIKRGGRHPPESWFLERGGAGLSIQEHFDLAQSKSHQNKVIGELRLITPSFESIHRNILRKFPSDVLRTY